MVLQIAVNPSRYLGLELWADYAGANFDFIASKAFIRLARRRQHRWVQLFPPTASAAITIVRLESGFESASARGSKIQSVHHGRRDGYPVHTFLKGGIPGAQPQNAVYSAKSLNDNLQVGFNYGGGVKFHMSDHFGLRLDLRGL